MGIKIKNFEGAIYDRAQNAKKQWDRGVSKYALEILDRLQERKITEIEPRSSRFLEQCLNGAKDWIQYSHGGCSLICDFEIAERLCSRTEIARKFNGDPNGKRPSAIYTDWLDAQADALRQAYFLICETATAHARMKDATKGE